MAKRKGNPKWEVLAKRLEKANKEIDDASMDIAAAQRVIARSLARIDKATQKIADIAAIGPGTFPNNMDTTGR